MAFIDDSVSPGKTIYNVPSTGPFVGVDLHGVQVYSVPDKASDPNPALRTPPVVGLAGIESVWISMMSDAEWFIIWGRAGAEPADPDPNATTTSNPSKQCVRIPPNFEYQRKIVAGDVFKLTQVTGSNIKVRLEVVSPIPG